MTILHLAVLASWAYKHALFQIGKHHQNIQKPQEIRFGKLSNEVSDCCLTPNEQCEELDISPNSGKPYKNPNLHKETF
jgi:hypothetical protein